MNNTSSKIKIFSFIFVVIVMSGCAATQLVKNQITSVSSPPLTYTFEKSPTINDLTFDEYTNERYLSANDVVRDGLTVKRLGDEILVTKFKDVGKMALDATVNSYKVKVTVNGNTITLLPYENRKHQAGLIMPFPIPAFSESDLNDFLSRTVYTFSFEETSEFPASSIEANFKRLATQDYSNNKYRVSIPEADAYIDIKTYPYRNGSKCEISVKFYTTPTQSNNIILRDVKEKVKSAIAKIVTA